MLKNIKRKATLESFSNMIPQLNNSQITPLLVPSSQDFDLERYNKDYHVFMQEVPFKELFLKAKIDGLKLINLKTKQEDLQHVTTILIQQNNEILSENKILFNELLKNRSNNFRF